MPDPHPKDFRKIVEIIKISFWEVVESVFIRLYTINKPQLLNFVSFFFLTCFIDFRGGR